jgi:hypothetical protein
MVAVVLAAVIASAVGLAVLLAEDDEEEVAPVTTTTTTEATTTTVATTMTYPLTGLPLVDPVVAARPALVVKIDNGQPRSGQGGRPQAGINDADVLFEEMVEGSVTRFAAVFHSTDVDPIGPVRSARTTDLLLMASLNAPLFAWSGANADVAAQVVAAPLVDVGASAVPSAYYRDSSRRAPYNLFSSTPVLRNAAPSEPRPPPPLFAYRPAGTPADGGRSVATVNIVFGDGPGSAPVDWTWDGTGWARTQRGETHVDANGVVVSPPNVVIRFARYVEVACCDTAGFPLVEPQLIGEGDVWVLTGGVLIEGRWSQPSLEAPATYTDEAGRPIRLTPGRTGVAIDDPGRATAA